MFSCGYIGKDEQMRIIFPIWNAYQKENPNFPILVKYPTIASNLHERLSEMVYHDRILYIVALPLQSLIAPLLDKTDTFKPTVVYNRDGVLFGYTIPITIEAIQEILMSRILSENNV